MSEMFDMSEVVELAGDIGASMITVPVAAKKLAVKEARDMASRMEADVPFRTGELQASVFFRETEDGGEAGATAEQGFYQEFGTATMAPQPWAFHNADKAETALANSLQGIPIL